MSVFGGDSWARDAQHRKRRLDELMLLSSSSASASFKKLSNGKFACLVCPHRPVLDSPLMLSIHNKGSQHAAAEARLREKELSRQAEINKRLALASDASSVANYGSPHPSVRPRDMKEKPLIEQTRRAILEAQSSIFSSFSANNGPHDLKRVAGVLPGGSQVALTGAPMEKLSVNTGNGGSSKSKREPLAGDQTQSRTLQEWQADLRNRQEQELRFIASGWKRDCHGRWYRDENVEFDSDEDDPNV